MIKSICINNFQSHKETKIEFSPNINIIIGSSDSGKTAIIRALGWIINNRPSGDSFISHWGGDTRVQIETDKGIIAREKGEGLNLYWLGIKTYQAFGQSVPDDIQNILNFSPINFQYQMDAPFLLSQSAGGIATYFNKIVNLEGIDNCINNISRKIKEITYKEKEDEEKKIEYENRIKKYSFIEKVIPIVNKCKEIEKDLNEKEKLTQKTSENLVNIKTTSNLLQNYNRLDDITLKIDYSQKILQEAKPIDRRISILQSIISQTRSASFSIKAIPNNIPNTKEWENLPQRIQKLKNLTDNIGLIIKNNLKTRKDILNITTEIRGMVNTFSKNMPKVCPLCGK